MKSDPFYKKWNSEIPLMKAVDELFCEDEISLGQGIVNEDLARKIAKKHNLDEEKVIAYAKGAMGI